MGRASWQARRGALHRVGALALLASSISLRPLSAQTPSTESLPPIDDLRELSDLVRRAGVPLLLFFSTPGCPYCFEVRRSYLAPRVRVGAVAGVIVREIDVAGLRAFIDGDGKRVTEADFAARYGARVVPFVILVDAALKPLGEPLIGLDRSGFYESFLQSAVDVAKSKLQPR